jgi:hypothetical protein
VETRYLTYAGLASVVAKTPDKRKETEEYPEQQIYITWWIPERDFTKGQMQLIVQARYENKSVEEAVHPIEHQRGRYIFSIDVESFKETQGLVTYRVFILNGKEKIASFSHPLWSKVIPIED